jgi:hypothetical protein
MQGGPGEHTHPRNLKLRTSTAGSTSGTSIEDQGNEYIING